MNLLALMKISNYPSDPSHIPDTRKSQIPVRNTFVPREKRGRNLKVPIRRSPPKRPSVATETKPTHLVTR